MADGKRPLNPSAGPEAYSAGAGKKQIKPRHRHPWLRRLAWAFGILVLLLVAVLVAGWLWLGTTGSLSFALTRAAPYLPAGQQLTSTGVSGSLRGGGHIDYLKWESPTLTVEAKNIDIQWSLVPLLRKQVQLGQLAVGTVTLTPHADPDAAKDPLKPLEQLRLPVDIDLPFSVARLVWQGPPAQTVRDLSGHYRYRDSTHEVDLAGLDIAQGHVSGTARLGANAPMPLSVQLDAQLQTPLPEDGPVLHVSVETKASGNVAGMDARLEMAAKLQQVFPAGQVDTPTPQPEATAGSQTPKSPRVAPIPMQAQATASIAPWAPQPLLQAKAFLEQVNLAAVVAGMPVTDLSGNVSAGPTENGWTLNAALENATPGPIDKTRLPVSKLTAGAHWDGTVWTVPEATVHAGGGTVGLSGNYAPSTGELDVAVDLARLAPGSIHTRFAAAPVDGTLKAKGTVQDLGFDLNLVSSGAGKLRSVQKQTPKKQTEPLRINRVVASGRWKEGVLTLPSAEVDALKAQLKASNVRVATEPALSISGKVQAKVPGLDLRADTQLAASSGKGSLQAQLRAAQETLAWVRELPGLEKTAAGLAVRGSADLSVDWTGGWATLSDLSKAGNAKLAERGRGDRGPVVNAKLSTPSLQIDIPQGEGVGTVKADLRNAQVTLDGNASRAEISAKGEVREGKRRVALDTKLLGSLQSSGEKSPVNIQAQLTRLALKFQDGVRNNPWSATLGAPLAIDLMQGQDGALSVKTSAGTLSLASPLPGAVGLRWDPIAFKRSTTGAMQVTSRGAFTGIPLAWSDLASAEGESPLKKLGLNTNLLFGGQWDVQATDVLSAKFRLQRSEGDMRIALDSDAAPTAVKSSGTAGSKESQPKTQELSSNSTIAAGVRDISLAVSAEGDSVSAEFLWDTAQAGTIRAQVATRLDRSDGGWAWAKDAPVSGKVRAQLPQVGVWSVLAPPGWRVSGTLEADATLSGSRSDPRWQGTLGADQLAVRSLLDGVDLQDGSLRARLDGNSVAITEFKLKGGKGNSARIAGFSGNRTSAPTDGGTLEGTGSVQWGSTGGGDEGGASPLRMDFKARARSLQLLVRADRQVSVSGTLDASLRSRQFKLRGDLTINRASIILPDAGAPKLGDDVVVRSAASDKLAQEKVKQAVKTAAAETSSTKPALTPDVVVVLDLGSDFALQGLGINTRLEGKITIRGATQAGAPPTVTGEVRTVAGRYRAWGQSLDVETGLIRFNGPYANPSLDILALRPNIDVRAGVQVTGTAQNPRVRLYSEPELPDAEKLSWVVLGRSAAGGGAEAAVLQQAALALLGSKSGGGAGTGIASKLGLDEIGFKGPGSGEDAAGAALTFGKRVSKDLYVTYERSLSGAMGTLYIFYDLSERLRLRGQTGAATGLDLIYTIRYE